MSAGLQLQLPSSRDGRPSCPRRSSILASVSVTARKCAEMSLPKSSRCRVGCSIDGRLIPGTANTTQQLSSDNPLLNLLQPSHAAILVSPKRAYGYPRSYVSCDLCVSISMGMLGRLVVFMTTQTSMYPLLCRGPSSFPSSISCTL